MSGSALELLTPEVAWPPGVRAAFTTRAGGVSRPPRDALNLADHVGDEAARVATNRARLQQRLPGLSSPVWLRQVHGRELLLLERRPPAGKPEADAVATEEAGRPCAVLAADCVPILLASADGRLVAAVHAGWRGLAAGILPAVLTRLAAHAPFLAWIGPCICGACYEVGDEVPTRLEKYREFFHSGAGAGKFLCDLPGIAGRQLLERGVSEVVQSGLCTFEDDRFFSFRRDGNTGRCAALIWKETGG